MKRDKRRTVKEQLHKRMSAERVWQVIKAVSERLVTAKNACQWLGIEKSRVYELVHRWKKLKENKESKEQELYPQIYVRSQEKKAPWIKQTIELFLKKEMYYLKNKSPFFKGHFNFAFLSDKCHQRFGVRLHRNSIRRWSIKKGYFNPKVHKTSKPYLRFEAGAIGLLVQHDTSQHVWMPYTKNKSDLILTIDDYSRKILAALLVPQETAWHHLTTVREVVELYGCPFAYYLDNHLIYGSTRYKKELVTHFSRALKSLSINLKFTAKQYPQAKGKVEKRFDYFQRRLPLIFEQEKVTSYTKANIILKEQVNYFNQNHIHAETKEIPDVRWNKAIKEGRSYFREVPKKTSLDIIFSLHYIRKVRPDGTITFSGKVIPLPGVSIRSDVTAALKPPTHKRPHTEIFVLQNEKTLKHLVLPGKMNRHFEQHYHMKKIIKHHSGLPDSLSNIRQLNIIDILGPNIKIDDNTF